MSKPRPVGPGDGPVAVTGSGGYIGSHIVLNLVEHGYEVDWYPYRGGHGLPPGLTGRLNQFLERVQNEQESDDA